MGVVISHTSALRCLRAWDLLPRSHRSPFCPGFPPARGTRTETGPFFLERPSAAQVAALLGVPNPYACAASPEGTGPDHMRGIGAQPSLFGGVVHTLAPDRGSRSQARGSVSHVWSAPLGARSLFMLQPGLCRTSPGLCFLHLAATLDPLGLLLLGYELLGTYAPCPTSPFGIRKRAPLANLEDLQGEIARAGTARGVDRARRSLGHMLPGAASPMEARLALMLTLPRRAGGYGLPAPLLNHTFDINGRSRAGADRRRYRGDLCWPDARVALEYDSDAAHTGSRRIAADARRRNALADRGIEVVGATRAQVSDPAELEALVQVVARKVGHRLRKPDPEQRRRREELHERLFGRSRYGAWPAARD